MLLAQRDFCDLCLMPGGVAFAQRAVRVRVRALAPKWTGVASGVRRARTGVARVDDEHEVEVAVADVADHRRDQARRRGACLCKHFCPSPRSMTAHDGARSDNVRGRERGGVERERESPGSRDSKARTIGPAVVQVQAATAGRV